MSENIELRSYTVRNTPDGDNIEEYHEIQHDTNTESLEIFASKFSPASINDYDFFTQVDSKTVKKKGTKKKKSKKKEISSNVMDIIASELASMTIPVTVENVVEKVEDKGEYYKNVVQSFSRDHREFRRRRPFLDSEHGFSRRMRAENLNPKFPNLLENVEEEAPSFPVEYVQPITLDELLESNDRDNREQKTKFLDISLRNITFKHHHKFSLEDLLCVKLIDNYNTFKNLQENLKELLREIKVNRQTKDTLKKDLLKVSPNKKDEMRFDATVRKYTKNLLELKVKHAEVIKQYKDVTHRIISVWSDIEMIREKFECKETPYELRINKQTLNDDEYDKMWKNIFEEEFNDMLTKIEYDFTSKCIEYKQRKNSDGRRLNKPKMNVDEDEIKDQVEKLVNNIIQRDKIDFNLEKRKINEDIKSIRNVYHFEVYVDKAFVCESVRYTATEWYDMNFNEYFSVEILSENEILRIVLVENNEKVAHVKVYLSELQKHRNDDYTEVEFLYDKNIEPTLNCVGSGHGIKEIAAVNKVRLKSSNIFKGNLTTSCYVNIQIKLNENVSENLNEAIKESLNIGNKLRRLMHGIDKPNMEVLIDIIGKIYGRDVSNDDTIVKTLHRLCKMEVNNEEQFHIDENTPECIRFKLLHLRNSGGFTNVENKMVPIHASQISTEQLNCLYKTKSKNFDLNYLRDKEADMDPIELQRFISAKFMQKLNKKMLRNLNEHLMVKTQKDIVREFRDFSLRSLFSSQKNGNSSSSISNSAKQQILMESLSKEQDIYITVQRAFNLLDRSTDILEDAEDDEETIAEPVSGYKVRPLRPFVRVSYHNTVAQTVTAIGCHPTWNHTLKLCTKLDPLSSLHIDIYDTCKENISEGLDDAQGMTFHYRYFNKWLGTAQIPLFTMLSLGNIRGTFKINTPPVLFGYETVQNKESHSLIPEITQLMKKDTSYIALHVTTGLAHLGGFQEYTQPLPSTVEDDYIIKHLNTFVTDYTNDFPHRNISLTFIDSAGRNKCVTQFLQPIPLPDRECFPFNPKSCGSAMSKSSGFSRSSSSKSSGKKREDEEKTSIRSQETWKGDGLVKTINACLRYVALIPSYEVCDTHVVTLMGLELLKVLHGSPLDHTLLLLSYFLYLGIKSWVGIGLGLPRGRSSYVLIQYDITARRFVLTGDELFRSRGFLSRNEGYLWYVCDAISGDRHELRDVGCPMKTVDFLFDNENIWVNVQSSQDCQNVSFDLSKSSDWQTVFDKDMFVMKHPIANDPNLYTSASNVETLRRTLEGKIKAKVQKWRPHMKTIWNRYCSTLLRDSLPHWEYWAFNPSENKPTFTQKLKQIMATYRMFGFPLNVPFINTKSVISAVKATGIHVCDDPNVEFALGVEVYGYPNNVLSVWVYLANITRM